MLKAALPSWALVNSDSRVEKNIANLNELGGKKLIDY